MTVEEILEAINRLAASEQDRLIQLLRQDGKIKPLNPNELRDLAKETAKARDSMEAAQFQAAILRGFHGHKIEF
jgi:hypothetical protein